MYNNTLNPRDYQTENMMDHTPAETDGRLTSDANEVYPEGGAIVNTSFQESWANSKGQHSPPLKKKKKGSDDTKTKISSYRQRYYDKMYNTNENSFNEDKAGELTVKTRSSAF
jgi:hypothetical protein